METLLSVDAVNLVLGEKQILKDLSFQVQDIHREGHTQGQVVGLLGPSGCGKTQLFRIIAGLNKPDSGTVHLGVEQKPVQVGQVGVVAQNYPLFEFRTVWQNLLVAGNMSGRKQDCVEKAASFLESFNLTEHRSKYPAQLSGGQRQRVAIAQQFMCSEHFLLMDEPFSGLDWNALTKAGELITTIAGQDELNTFVIVTHDISAAIAVCDTILVMGRESDRDGNKIPGSKIIETYDLVERGLAWQKDIAQLPAFGVLLSEIRALFPTL